ncbi:MAG TPA: hypothetical protein VKR58_06355 [Aquella sp.]|nr:hypothetical protein [Aquella sp.]
MKRKEGVKLNQEELKREAIFLASIINRERNSQLSRIGKIPDDNYFWQASEEKEKKAYDELQEICKNIEFDYKYFVCFEENSFYKRAGYLVTADTCSDGRFAERWDGVRLDKRGNFVQAGYQYCIIMSKARYIEYLFAKRKELSDIRKKKKEKKEFDLHFQKNWPKYLEDLKQRRTSKLPFSKYKKVLNQSILDALDKGETEVFVDGSYVRFNPDYVKLKEKLI